MKTIPSNSKYMRRAQALVFAAPLLAVLLLPQTLRASLPIEEAQREFQARYYFTYGSYVQWLPCPCQTPAPAFPTNGFYGDLDHNPVLAVQLVQDLANKFFPAVNPLYGNFLNTPDGSSGIVGQTSPPANYTDIDFPTTTNGVNLTLVTSNNYANCFPILRGYYERITNVSCSSDPANVASKSGSGSTTNCAGAIALAKSDPDTGWERNADWNTVSQPHFTDIGVSTVCWHDTNVNPIAYYAEKSATTGQVHSAVSTLFPRLTSGNIRVYLSAAHDDGGAGLDPPSFTVDGAYHLFDSQGVGPGTEYYSSALAYCEPDIGGNCEFEGRGDRSDLPSGAYQGWNLLDAVIVLQPAFTADPDHVQCGGGGCASCGGQGNIPGKPITANSSLEVQISLGPDSYGKPAGYFYLHADQFSPALFSPASLAYSSIYGAGVATDYGGVISAPNATAYVLPTGAGYALYFTNQNVYPPELLSSVTIESNSSPNQVVITEVLGSNGSPRVIQFSNTVNAPNSWTWDMIEGNGLRVESRTTTWSTPTNRADTVVVKNNTGAVAAQTTENYCLFPWGLTLVQQTLGTGSSAKITTWTYYTNAASDAGNYGQINQLVEPSGRWEKYQYDSAGRLTYKVAQFGNNATTTLDNSNRVTQVTYSGNVITTVESLLGNEVARTYEVVNWDEANAIEQIQTIRCATSGAGIGAGDNLTNIVWQTTSEGNSASTGHAWDTVAELRPDRTMTFYQYADLYNGSETIVQAGDTGHTWGDEVGWTPLIGWRGVTNGTQTTTTLLGWGQPQSVAVADLLSTLPLGEDDYTYTDDLNRSYYVVHPDGRTETFNYACCGLDTYIDRDGVTNQYFYDAAKRQIASLRLGILTSNVLDAAGNVLKTFRFGTDGSPIVLGQTAYDLAGRVLSETNALNGFTSHSETYGGNGRTDTTTYPDTGTRVELYNQDGSLQSVTGTAVFPVYYQYGYDAAVGSPYTLETKGSSTGSEWTKTYSDMLGRAYKTVYADGASSQALYNNQGQQWHQVDPDLVSTLYAFNNKGEQTYFIVDCNTNAQIDWSGSTPDRITLVTNDVVNNDPVSGNGITVNRTRTFVWATTANTPTLVRTEETSADGLQSWSTVWNNGVAAATHSQTAYGPNGARTVTTTAPDGSYSLSAYQNGRLTSVTRYDSIPHQLSSINYSYDPHGRVSTATDARNGATTWTYQYNSDLLSTITTPNPGTLGGSPQTTITYYNPMLQATNVVQPDGTSVTSEYYPTGQLKRQYGSRTYPVGYGYDYAGRVLTMTNWTAFPATGTRVTTWNYNPSRGWLGSKTYDGGAAGPSYQYTPAGRLHSRTWARNTTTTYTYDNAGGLATVGYSDGTTPGVSYTYDRRGRPATVTQNGIQNTLSYNDANLLLSEAYSGGLLANLSVTSGYDQYLRRTSLTLNSQPSTLNSVSYGYDNASRLQTVTDNTTNTPYSATYSYLANSLLVSNIVFKQSSTTRMSRTNQWDYLNRLLGVSSAPCAASALSFAYSYNNANQRTRTALADNSYWSFNYDSLGQATSGHKYWSDQTPVAGQQFDYAFDNIGNRLSTKAGGDQNGANQRTANYGANTLNQYTNRDVPGAVDIVGVGLATNAVTVNGTTAYRKGEYFRQQVSVSNGNNPVWQNMSVAESGQTSVSGNVFVPKNQEQFSYDLDGNLTQDGRWTYGWDAENRLISLTPSTSVGPQISLKFEYDWQGRRIHKQVWNGANWIGSITNDAKLVYDGWNLVAELDALNASTLLRSYVWGLDLSGSSQGAGGVGGLLKVLYNGTQTTNCFVAFDGNGNVAGLVNAADGTFVAQSEYGPFGEVLRATGPMAKVNPIRWSTKYQDDETDLVMYPGRPYSPTTGRWLCRDLINENGGLNLYGFVRNDPVRRFDALGQADGSTVGWPYPSPKPGEPPPSYPPSMPFPTPPSKMFKKLDCSCCGKDEVDAGLTELKRRFGLAQTYLDKSLKPGDMDPNGVTSCAGSNERVLQFMEPTPRCWICFMDRRWDADRNNPPHGRPFRLPPPIWDENFIHCFTVNPNNIQKEIVFDYFEYRYNNGRYGNGTYEGNDLATFYTWHPYPGKSEAGGWPRWVNCNEPDKKWNPDYGTFSQLIGKGRISE